MTRKRSRGDLKAIIGSHGISQVQLAVGIGRSEGFVSRLIHGEVTASQETISAILSFLTKRLGRRVTYEEIFPAAIGGAA